MVQLFPRMLARVIAETPEAEVGPFASCPLLLVRTDDPEGKLAQGLATDNWQDALTEPSHTKTSLDRSHRNGETVLVLERELRAARHVVVFVMKRYERLGDSRVCVGRDATCDIRLDDP